MKKKHVAPMYRLRREKKVLLTPEQVRVQLLLSFKDLRVLGIPYSRAHLYRLIRADAFPRPVSLSESRVAFRCEEVMAWISERRPVVFEGEAA